MRRKKSVSTGSVVNKLRMVLRLQELVKHIHSVKGTPAKLQCSDLYRHVAEVVNPTAMSVGLWTSQKHAQRLSIDKALPAAVVAKQTNQMLDMADAVFEPEADAAALMRIADDQAARLVAAQQKQLAATAASSNLLETALQMQGKVGAHVNSLIEHQTKTVGSTAAAYRDISEAATAADETLSTLAAFLKRKRLSDRCADKTATLDDMIEFDIDEYTDDDLEDFFDEAFGKQEERMKQDRRGLIQAYIGLTTFCCCHVQDKPAGLGKSNKGRLHNADHQALTDTFSATVKLISKSGNKKRLYKIAIWAEAYGIARIWNWKARRRSCHHPAHHQAASDRLLTPQERRNTKPGGEGGDVPPGFDAYYVYFAASWASCLLSSGNGAKKRMRKGSGSGSK